MQIGFFEVEDWEIETIKKNFPSSLISADKINAENVHSYTGLEAVSTFIYSDLQAPILEKLLNLKLIATHSTGWDHVDNEYCKSHNIAVVNVPTYGERTVAEHTFGLILTLTRKLYDSIEHTKRGNYSIEGLRGIDLCGKTLGVIGLGNIGVEVVKIAKGFDMKVLVYTRTQKPELATNLGFTYADLSTLLSTSDIITLHIPYTKETHHLINKESIMNMKKNSYLINTSRGGLIDSEAIFIGLEKEILAGVGLDVLEDEFVLKEEAQLLSTEFRKQVNYESLVYDHLILRHPKVVVTPHNAFNSQEAIERILTTTIANITAFIGNVPQNTV